MILSNKGRETFRTSASTGDIHKVSEAGHRQQRRQAKPAAPGGQSQDQRWHPLESGHRKQDGSGVPLRHLAGPWSQSPPGMPPVAHIPSSLNSYTCGPLEARPKGPKSLKNVTPPDTSFRPELPRKGVSGRVSSTTLLQGIWDLSASLGSRACRV